MESLMFAMDIALVVGALTCLGYSGLLIVDEILNRRELR